MYSRYYSCMFYQFCMSHSHLGNCHPSTTLLKMPEEQASPCYSMSVGWVDLSHAIRQCLLWCISNSKCLQNPSNSSFLWDDQHWSTVKLRCIDALKLHCFTLSDSISFDFLRKAWPMSSTSLQPVGKRLTASQRDPAGCWARSCTRLRLNWDLTGKATQVTLGLWLARRLSSHAFCRAPSHCVNLSSILQTTGLNSSQRDRSSLIIESYIRAFVYLYHVYNM